MSILTTKQALLRDTSELLVYTQIRESAARFAKSCKLFPKLSLVHASKWDSIVDNIIGLGLLSLAGRLQTGSAGGPEGASVQHRELMQSKLLAPLNGANWSVKWPGTRASVLRAQRRSRGRKASCRCWPAGASAGLGSVSISQNIAGHAIHAIYGLGTCGQQLSWNWYNDSSKEFSCRRHDRTDLNKWTLSPYWWCVANRDI